MEEKVTPQHISLDEPPPVFKSWSGWYALVLVTLLSLIAFFYAFTKAFE